MNWLNIFLVAFSMSIDAASVNITNGVCGNTKKRVLILCAFVFGLFQFIMPVIGYFVGYAFKDTLSKYVPWIAFGLLTLLAIKSFVEWIKEFKEKDKDKCENHKLSIGKILVEGVATSIDALSIGFIYIDQSVSNALIIFGIIGIVTFVFASFTGILAKYSLSKLDKYSGLIAAIVFLAVGIKILLEGIL